MKTRIALALLVLAAFSINSYAQCNAQVDVRPNNTITVTASSDMPALAVGDAFDIGVDGASLPVTVVRVDPPDDVVTCTVITTSTIDPTGDVIHALADSTSATITAKGKSVTARVHTTAKPKNSFKYDWSIGPATKGDEDGEADEEGDGGESATLADEDPPADDTGDTTGAIRFRYEGEYAHGGFFGQGSQGRGKLLQTTANLLIDTTDQDDPNFIDNNKLALGVRATGLGLGRLWMHGTAGIEAKIEKAFHHENRNADVVAKVTGWVPVARSITLFPKNGVFIAAPLSFTASYGYRNKDQNNVESQGRVFEATALYHLFLMDQFQIDFSATLTHSDLDDMPADTPKTQRMYKATISYLTDPAKGFKVLTSVENGSFGVMLKEVRQYFVGVAISKLNFSGK